MDFQNCPQCETLNPPAAKRCAQCNAELPEVPEFVPSAPPVRGPEAVVVVEPEVEPAEPSAPRFEAPPEVLARVAKLEAEIKGRPNANALYLQLCQVYLERHRKDLAIQVLERCLEHDPKNVSIRHRLSQITGIAPAPVVVVPKAAPRVSAVHPVTRPARPAARRADRRLPGRWALLGGTAGLVALALGAKLLLFPGPRCLVTGGFSASAPAWSPVGNQFAFLVQEGGRTRLGVYDLRKGEHRTLVDVVGADASAYAWSPDGRRLAYVGKGEGEWEEAVFAVDVESGQARRVMEGSAPFWSPDGTSLLMWCAGTGASFDDEDAAFGSSFVPPGPCRVSVESGAVTRGGELPWDVSLGWGAAVSPVLGRIAFERSSETATAVVSGETTSVDGEFVEMVDAVAARGATNLAEGSRDLSRELEARQRMERRRSGQGKEDSGLASDIYVVDFLGGQPRPLTSDGRSRAPVWTADGARILYASGGELWMRDADGGVAQPVFQGLPKVTPDSRATLTRDGREVVFVAPVEADQGLAQLMTGETPADLHVARVGGSSAKRLANRHPFKQRFALAPDGKRIVYEVVADPGTLTDPRTRSELWMMSR